MILTELPKGNVWVTADTHFHQKEVLHFYDVDSGSKDPMRKFDSIEEMNDRIIDEWRECLKPGDSLWHLGDCVFNDEKGWKWFNETMPDVLKGVGATIILGNHDNGMKLAQSGFFDNVDGDIDARSNFGFYASHEPMHIDALWHWERTQPPSVNIHGHIHAFADIGPLWMNVCVEKTDYKPVNLEDLMAKAKEVRDNWDPSEYGPSDPPSEMRSIMNRMDGKND